MDTRDTPEPAELRRTARRRARRLGRQAADDLGRADGGHGGARRGRSDRGTDRDDVALETYLHSRAQSVMGGTSQIQKNIIATRILGLPAG
jgi:alkylation response protein AidB-like acyl-CoA dehydrogenase